MLNTLSNFSFLVSESAKLDSDVSSELTEDNEVRMRSLQSQWTLLTECLLAINIVQTFNDNYNNPVYSMFKE